MVGPSLEAPIPIPKLGTTRTTRETRPARWHGHPAGSKLPRIMPVRRLGLVAPRAVLEDDRDGADLDEAVVHAGALLGPGEGGGAVGDLDHERAGELLLGVRERAVLDLQRAGAQRDGRRARAGLQDAPASRSQIVILKPRPLRVHLD